MENRLKEIIKDKGCKQTWIAEKVGVSKVVVSMWANTRRQPNGIHLIKLSEALNCEPREVYYGE